MTVRPSDGRINRLITLWDFDEAQPNFAWNSREVFGNAGRGTRPYYGWWFAETTG
jgi:hypothetical protein